MDDPRVAPHPFAPPSPRELLGARLLIAGLVALIVVAAVGLGARGEAATPGSFGVLEAPVSEIDRRYADLADLVRSSTEWLAENAPVELDAGFRGSFRGDAFARAEGGYGESIANVLIRNDLVAPGALREVEASGARLILHQCDDRLGVLIESTVVTDPESAAWWDERNCDLALDGVFAGATYLALSDSAVDGLTS